MLRSKLAAIGQPSKVVEENSFKHKSVTGKEADTSIFNRPTTRAALGDIRNRQGNGAVMPKKSIGVPTKADGTALTVLKDVQPRRALRSTASASNAQLGGNTSLAAAVTRARVASVSGPVVHAVKVTSIDAQKPAVGVASKSILVAKNERVTRSRLATVRPSLTLADGNRPKEDKEPAVKGATLARNAAEALPVVTEAEVEQEAAAIVSADNTAIKDKNAYSTAMIPNIDDADHDNPQLVAEYVNDIYEYMRALERQQMVREQFLEGREITPRMRAILVDWLIQVHLRFHLLPETMFMTVALIDRFLQAVDTVAKEDLQLVGVAAMFVASKYEEMYAPEIADFVYITDQSCSKQQIRRMECLLLRTLQFRIGRPLPIHFLRRYSKAADADATRHTLAKYFLEISLIHYSLSHVAPSLLAAAAIWLATKLLTDTVNWAPVMVHYTTYTETDIMPYVHMLCRAVVRMHTQTSKQQAIRNKFSTSKFMEISKHECLSIERIQQIVVECVSD